MFRSGEIKIEMALWAGWGRDYARYKGWRFDLILWPRPDLTPPGGLLVGWHFSLWADWVDCDVRAFRVRPPPPERPPARDHLGRESVTWGDIMPALRRLGYDR